MNDQGEWRSISINPPIYPDVTWSDLLVITDFKLSFQEKGLYFEFNQINTNTSKRFLIAVVKVPECLHSRATREVNI